MTISNALIGPIPIVSSIVAEALGPDNRIETRTRHCQSGGLVIYSLVGAEF